MVHLLSKCLFVVTLVAASTGGLYTYAEHLPPPPAFAQHQKFMPTRVTPKDIQCLTRAIYYEAGTESPAGKEAVAIVVVNRLVHQRYPNTICGVVNQSFFVNEKLICQFSFHCEPPRSVHRPTWDEAHQMAKRVLTNSFHYAILSRVGDATYFHAKYVHPQWSKQKVFVTAIDHHLFYREPSL